MLERLVHGGSARIPKTQRVILITIPARVGKEIRGADRLPRVWYATDCLSARAFGDQWRAEQRSAVLIVPSVIAKYECNVVINPAHTDARWIVASKPEPVAWDVRLFARTRGRLGR
jgi:RES domain-containing protein